MNDPTITETVIPAMPGYSVVQSTYTTKIDEVRLCSETVIAWHVMSRRTNDGNPVSDVYPVTAETGTFIGDIIVRCPDGGAFVAGECDWAEYSDKEAKNFFRKLEKAKAKAKARA